MAGLQAGNRGARLGPRRRLSSRQDGEFGTEAVASVLQFFLEVALIFCRGLAPAE